jgi:osmotically-inducible protein OsmY
MNHVSQNGQRATQPFPNQSSDQDLTAAAADAIAWLTTVPLEALKVSAQNGWLYLEGTVNSACERIIVEEVTRWLNGVRGIYNYVEVRGFRS